MTGAPNTDSRSTITRVGRAEEEDRKNRSGLALMISVLCPARVRIAWCMVGTPVYQLGRVSAIQEKNFRALNRGAQHTCPPAERGASSPVIKPWIWNSGMMHNPRSSAERP